MTGLSYGTRYNLAFEADVHNIVDEYCEFRTYRTRNQIEWYLRKDADVSDG